MSAAAAAATARRRAILEMRTYDVAPEHMAAFLGHCDKHYAMRTAHSPTSGFFAAEAGALNQVTHLWEFQSAAARDAVRRSLKGDAAWAADYLKPTRHMLQRQVNTVWAPASQWAVDAANSHAADGASPQGPRFFMLEQAVVPAAAAAGWVVPYADIQPADGGAAAREAAEKLVTGAGGGVAELGRWALMVGEGAVGGGTGAATVLRLLAADDVDALIQAPPPAPLGEANGFGAAAVPAGAAVDMSAVRVTQRKVVLSTPFAKRIGARWF